MTGKGQRDNSACDRTGAIGSAVSVPIVMLMLVTGCGLEGTQSSNRSPVTGKVRPPAAAPDRFIEEFAGSPSSPTPWTGHGWDLTISNRDQAQLHSMTPMQADHGAACNTPPATHTVSDYSDVIYQCNEHVMTATYGKSPYGGYAMIYLTPGQVVDTRSDFEIAFDVSTFQTNRARDWIDLWLTLYNANLQLALDHDLPDAQGEPTRSLHLKQQQETWWTADLIDNQQITRLPTSFEVRLDHIPPSRMIRTRHVLRVPNGRMQFGIPEVNLWWYDGPVPKQLRAWGEVVVQFGHHSYTPDKDCADRDLCGPNTYHWDNVELSPATPFSIGRANHRLISETTPQRVVQFDKIASGNAHLRFAGIGDDLQFSLDNGQTWQTPRLQVARIVQPPDSEKFRSYWTAIPAGTSRVMFRGNVWWGGEWAVRDASIWSR